MKSLSLTALLITLCMSIAVAADITYTVSMPEPHTHYYEVEMEISRERDKVLTITLPTWTPGSYLIREFSKSLEEFKVVDQRGEALEYIRKDKNTWEIQRGNARSVVVSYRIYAYELTVRTSYLDASHGYFNGTNLFMYLEGHEDEASTVVIKPYQGWTQVSTGLKAVAGEQYTYTADNFDQLVDCPFEIGTHPEWSFEAAGIPHRMAMYGVNNYDQEMIEEDVPKVVEVLTDIFGENPNDDYLFIVHNVANGGGGLEHMNSTTIQVRRWGYHPNRYRAFLGLVAHEYFHLWNVKRIRPEALGPFDYENENYTRQLWAMEGITSYYSEVALLRGGWFTPDEFASDFISTLSSVENQPGTRVQSMGDASFDAWVKSYRPNENSYNSTISYYPKGKVLAGLLDIMILNATDGEKRLDDVMRLMWEQSKEMDRGFTDAEILEAFETVSGLELDQWFEDHIYNTKTPDYETILGYVGLLISDDLEGSTAPYFGGSFEDEGQGLIIDRVKRGSTAYEGGLNVEDELIAINGYRIWNEKDIERVLETVALGDTIEVTISRDELIQTLSMEVRQEPGPDYSVEPNADMTDQQRKILKAWLSL